MRVGRLRMPFSPHTDDCSGLFDGFRPALQSLVRLGKQEPRIRPMTIQRHACAIFGEIQDRIREVAVLELLKP